jgi:DNA-binding transcriptional LysR family regulator
MRLTAAGERFKSYAEDALERHRQFLISLIGAEGVLSGDLSIIASTTTGEFIVPDLVARFTVLHPDVVPEVFVTDTGQVVEEMADTRWDIGFVGARLPGRGLRYEVIGTDEILLAVSASHPFAKRSEIELSELEGQPFLQREGGSGTLRSVHTALAKYSAVLPPHPIAMGVSSPQAILAGVERGYGMGWVSAYALVPGWNGRVSSVRIKGLPLRRFLYLVQNRQRDLPTVATKFTDWVRNESNVKSSFGHINNEQ